ncbi:MAG: carboxypeptidase-like regulatory domain-containing protein [Bernardetiaceae bacterium]|nr:carboxypeptidase-like regulatory domain-containing protein [Bernardetiaceae bacterium]
MQNIRFFILILSYGFIFLLFFLSEVRSQNLEGQVFDAETKEPLTGASVYLDGTTLGTVTDSEGKYSIEVSQRINTNLIIRFIGYKSEVIANPFETKFSKVYLQPSTAELEEIIVSDGLFTREEMLEAFREQFLGRTSAGKTASIQNEEDIQLFYDGKTNSLKATASKPLKVENPFLGYRIIFTLYRFETQFNQLSLKYEHAKNCIFYGTNQYEDIEGSASSKMKRRRYRTYMGSKRHFFKTLATNSWGRSSFLLYRNNKKVDTKEFFSVRDSAGIARVKVLKNFADLIEVENVAAAPSFFSTIIAVYRLEEQSRVVFKTDIFYVDDYGNYDAVDKIQFGGGMGVRRLADMLPLDYRP